MRRMMFVLLIGGLVLGAAIAQEPNKDSTRVEGTVFVPKELPSFTGRVLEIRLYQYDPRIADKGADLIEKVDIKDFAHVEGKETKKEFVVGAKGKIVARMSYYVTVFVLEDGKRTHIGECEHVKGQGLCKVLTDGNPNKIQMQLREVKK